MSLPPEHATRDKKLKISNCLSVRANLLYSLQCETPCKRPDKPGDYGKTLEFFKNSAFVCFSHEIPTGEVEENQIKYFPRSYFGYFQLFRSEFCKKSRRQQNSSRISTAKFFHFRWNGGQFGDFVADC